MASKKSTSAIDIEENAITKSVGAAKNLIINDSDIKKENVYVIYDCSATKKRQSPVLILRANDADEAQQLYKLIAKEQKLLPIDRVKIARMTNNWLYIWEEEIK